MKVMMASFKPSKNLFTLMMFVDKSVKAGRDFIVPDKDLELVATYLDGAKRYQVKIESRRLEASFCFFIM